ncbi:MAG: hypothetical protein GWP09_01010 [Nitrospiraceae bacterium]|nr:hypothetical protein [Nitrospiraceae bacterium]
MAVEYYKRIFFVGNKELYDRAVKEFGEYADEMKLEFHYKSHLPYRTLDEGLITDYFFIDYNRVEDVFYRRDSKEMRDNLVKLVKKERAWIMSDNPKKEIQHITGASTKRWESIKTVPYSEIERKIFDIEFDNAIE